MDQVKVPEALQHDFEIVGVLGQGGMGLVVHARNRRLGREVAIKTLREPQDARRMEREAQILAHLAHDNIVRVYNFAQVGDTAYLEMELVPFETLEARQGRKPLNDSEILDVGATLADTLAYAHSQGVIHRDLKPANLFVGPELRLKVADFGLARAVDTDRLTRTGVILGTPDYIAPEQLRGEVPGPAVDQYAMGVLLYELLARRRPFLANDTIGLLMARLETVPESLSTLRPDLPLILTTGVMRMLEREPGSRFPDMAAVAEMLRAAGAATGTASARKEATVVIRRRSAPVPVLGPRRMAGRRLVPSRGRWLAAVALGVVVTGLWLSWRPGNKAVSPLRAVPVLSAASRAPAAAEKKEAIKFFEHWRAAQPHMALLKDESSTIREILNKTIAPQILDCRTWMNWVRLGEWLEKEDGGEGPEFAPDGERTLPDSINDAGALGLVEVFRKVRSISYGFPVEILTLLPSARANPIIWLALGDLLYEDGLVRQGKKALRYALKLAESSGLSDFGHWAVPAGKGLALALWFRNPGSFEEEWVRWTVHCKMRDLGVHGFLEMAPFMGNDRIDGLLRRLATIPGVADAAYQALGERLIRIRADLESGRKVWGEGIGRRNSNGCRIMLIASCVQSGELDLALRTAQDIRPNDFWVQRLGSIEAAAVAPSVPVPLNKLDRMRVWDDVYRWIEAGNREGLFSTLNKYTARVREDHVISLYVVLSAISLGYSNPDIVEFARQTLLLSRADPRIWVSAAGPLAPRSCDDLMDRWLLDLQAASADARWPSLLRSLWLSRRRDFLASLDWLERAHLQDPDLISVAVEYEILTRPLWYHALGQPVDPKVLYKIQHMEPVRLPKSQATIQSHLDDVWIGLRSHDYARAMRGGRWFTACQGLWTNWPAYAALGNAAMGDLEAAKKEWEQLRRLSRYERTGNWIVQETADLLKGARRK